jgi:hypothetical protein
MGFWRTLECWPSSQFQVNSAKANAKAAQPCEESNVIIRNLGVKKVLADNGDAIGVGSAIVWLQTKD